MVATTTNNGRCWYVSTMLGSGERTIEITWKCYISTDSKLFPK
ncbi:hypothetical protein ANCCAN_30424 [Ancylostoma caninum]|uniref:Uncharacterized protein n=1 Tax=Ancylostoma caninum TaxID=29170 RepID=A0A368F129_ANCCA|nr:hypothetical protein ANCCAN_30424 [Ancylostoma caninum]